MKTRILCIAMILCCFLGCGKQPVATEPEVVMSEPEVVVTEPTVDYSAQYLAQEEKDPFDVVWKAEEVENGECFYRQETYQAPLLGERPENGWPLNPVGFGGTFYTGYSSYPENSTPSFYVDHVDLETLEHHRIHYTEKQNTPTDLVYDGERLYGVFQTWEDGLISGLELTELMADGSFGESIDLYPVAKEKELLPTEQNYAFDATIHYCPEKEVIYLIPFDGGIYVIGKAGKLQYEFTGFAGEKAKCSLFSITPKGDAVFISYDQSSNTSTYFMYDNQDMKKLYSEQGQAYLWSLHMPSFDAYGNVLYLHNDKDIVSWNVESGKRERLYVGAYGHFDDLKFLYRTKEGKYVLIFDDIEGMSLSLYSPSGPAKSVELRLETTNFFTADLREKVMEFERTHPGVIFRFGDELTNYDEIDLRVAKLYQECVDGNGPDLIYTTPEYLERFAKNGVLMDMSGVIDEEEFCILPGVFESGKIDGKQYLFPFSAHAYPILVKKSVWDKPGWTVEEVLNLLEEQERKHGEEFYLATYYDGCASCWWILDFFTKDIEHSPFLDMESHTCDFEGELFRRVLETCKQQEGKRKMLGEHSYNDVAEIKAMKEDKCLIIQPIIFDFDRFSSFQAGLRDDCNWVGYPTDSENGKLLAGDMGLVVNNNTEHREIIEEFLRCAYSFDYMLQDVTRGVPLRTDILEKSVIEKCDWSNDIQIRTGRRTYVQIQGKKEDGTSYKKEYMDYLTSCKASKSTCDEIITIIQEEAEAYFQGQKSVTEVQRLIQNRVSLYLKEQN